MATIITRETGTTAVNRALTNTELDNNFINLNTDIGTRILSSEKAAVNGVATLDATGKVPATQLPSYVDDVQEAANLAAFPATGETGKIYVALDTNKAYRWSGSVYVYITSGAVDSVAGRTGVVVLTKSDVGLANADNTADSSKNVLSATKWTTARTISITGDLSGSVSVDGTANASITGTLPATGVSAGSYGSATAIPVFTVDAKGRITAASTSAITVGNGALSLSISTGSTNTAVSVGTGTGFTANSSSAASYTMTVGPALVNLATLMTTAGAGFIRRGATADTYTIDTNTYLTAEADTLATVTARGASTSTSVTLSGTGNQFGGHFYFLPYDAAGNHYPHFNDGGSASGSKINWRLYTGVNNTVTHTWTTSLATFATNIAASNFSGSSSGTNTGDNPGVTSVAAVTPIISSGGTTPSISHATSGATAGTYNNVTVNTFGHVTSGSNTAYLTTLTDTLATVTGRGATTSTNVSLNGGISSYMGDSGVLFQSYNTSASNAAQFNISHSLGAVTISNARGALTLNGNVSGSSGSTTGSATSLYSPNAATVVAADSAMPAQGNSLIHTLALGPSGNDGHIIGMTWANTSTIYGAQIWLDTDPTNAMAIRGRSSTGVWTAWAPVLTSGNYNSYSPTLTGGGASGTWGISITGGAATATTAGSVTGLTLTSSANGINPDNVTQNQIGYNTSVSLFGQTDGGLYSSAYSSSWIHQIYGDFRTGQIAIRGKNSGTWQAWRTVVDSSNVSSYAVSSISATSPIVASASTGAITLSHANSGVTAGTYNNVTVNNKGHVTAGSNAAYLTAEADTLATVTGRGATTTTPITLQRIFWNTDGGNSNNTFAANHYSIGQAAGAWTHPYPDLIIGHHTGIRIGAHYNYGGTRFYNNSPWGGDTGGGETELMSIGNGDDHVRIAQIGYAGNSFRAPIFYDSNDTSYYVDPASTSDTAQRMRGGTVYGPNVTWGAYLLVGGDGRQNYTNTAYASVCTTNGNLHLDSGTAAATHINWYDGTDLLVGAGDSGTLRFKVYGVDNYSYATGSMRSPIFYDSDDTAYYGDFAGTSRANLIKANSVYDWSTTRGIIPNGASYTTSAGAVTGAFKIKLPDGSRLLYPMLSFTVQLYNYSTGTSRTFRIGGHFSGASWHNIFAYCLTDYADSLNVRFGYDAANAMCVWIGETGTTWSYPQVFVTDFQNGYSAIQESWFTGWSITLVTAFDTVSNGPYTPAMGLNSKNYNSYAPTLTGTGASGTWGISISGNAATSTTSANTNAVNITSTGGTTFYLLGTHTNSAGARSVVYGVPYYNSATGRLNVPNGIVLDAGNYNNYSPSLTGNGASGTWGISISGTAANATNVPWTGITSRPADVMYYEGFTLDANTMSRNSTGFSYSVNAPWTGPIARFSAGGSYDLWLNAPYGGGGNQLSFRTRNGDTATYNAWKAVLHDGNYNSYSPTLTGTGASGTWGINITGNSGTTSQTTWTDLYVNSWFRNNSNNTGLYNQANGNHFYSRGGNRWGLTGNSASSNIYLDFYATHENTIRGSVHADTSNNIGFLNTSGNWSFMVSNSGNATATGTITANSDERLKKDWTNLPSNFVEKLSKVKSGTYTRIDTDVRQAGSSAQEWQILLPEVVITANNEDKTLSLAYGNAALVSAIELAKEVVNLNQRIAKLEALVAQLIEG